MKKLILLSFTLLYCFFQSFAITEEDEKLISVIKDEMQRNMDVLSKQEIPAYYLSIRITQAKTIDIRCKSGAKISQNKQNDLNFCITMRVGSKEKDNTHVDYMNKTFFNVLPIEFNEEAIRTTLWQTIDNLYKTAKTSYQQMQTNLATRSIELEKANDFTDEEVSFYYEKPNGFDLKTYNIQPVENLISKINVIVEANDDVIDNALNCSLRDEREIFIDTEGSQVCQNHQFFQLISSIYALCDDGMIVNQYRSFCSPDLNKLPDENEVDKQIKEMSENISKTKRAPIADSYNGPIILSGQAAGVFFHEFLGHRIEATRMRSSNDGQTFKKKLGQEVLSDKISVVFDPNIKDFNGKPLIGGYVYDNEGVKGQRVEVIKDGILKGFLTNRTPIEGFPKSNGHGRGFYRSSTVARQSNMFISSPNAKSAKELREDFINLLKKENKEYGYLIKEISGGVTQTSAYSTNSFNINPLLTYKIYADGRQDEIVRGLNIIGTPLNAMSKISSCGNDYEIFNGICGAETGSVLVSSVSPSIIVSSMETQKSVNQNKKKAVLDAPKDDSSVLFDNDVVLSAMKKEIDRTLTIKNDNPKLIPFFASCVSSEQIDSYSVSARDGKIDRESDYINPIQCNIRLLLNNNHETQELGTASWYTVLGNYSSLIENLISLPFEKNELAIRKELWKTIDNIYSNSIAVYNQKINTIANTKIPKEYEGLDDFDKNENPPLEFLQKDSIKIDENILKQTAIKASKVLRNKCVENNIAFLKSVANANYGSNIERVYTTEGNVSRIYKGIGTLSFSINGIDKEGTLINKSINICIQDPLKAISDENIEKACDKLVSDVCLSLNPKKDDKSYFGPVLIRGNYSPVLTTIFNSNSNTMSFMARPIFNSYSNEYPQMLSMKDRKVVSKHLSIYSVVGSDKINDAKNFNYSPIDFEGTATPKELVVIEKGILKNLMKGRAPLPDYPASTGHFTNKIAWKVISDKCYAKDKLKKQLIKLAKDETLPYAYIIDYGNSDITNNYNDDKISFYQVNLKTGEETLVTGVSLSDSFKNLRVLRNVFGTSNQYKTYYIDFNAKTHSYIAPDQILLEDVDLIRKGEKEKRPVIVPQKESKPVVL
ncbi:MAG: metallopeptidase TldD-related protein [Bacteroidales bacterium]|nr:metallopeptidase TldD-related protein [Bacteroidales bacterium]